MTRFEKDEDRDMNPSTIAPGGNFGETDSPDGTAPDISTPLSSPAGPDYPDRQEGTGFTDSDMRGLAEHGYDGTGNLKSAVDYDPNQTKDSNAEEYSDGSFNTPKHQAFSGEGLGKTPDTIHTPGSVMREDDGVTVGPGLTPTRDDNTFTTNPDRVPSEDRTNDSDKDSGGMMGNLKDKLEEAKEGILGGNKK